MKVWPIPIAAAWLSLPLFAGVFAASIEPIPPHDYWWHLAMGRLIAATGHLPDANLFLYTLPADLPFLNQPWLGQFLMWESFATFGHGGGIWLRNVLLATALGFIIAAAQARGRDSRSTGGLTLLAIALAYPVLTVRTRMFAFVPFAIILWTSIGVAEGRIRSRWLLVVPVATAFWANVHGSFILGPAIVGAVTVGLALEGFLRDRSIDPPVPFLALATVGSLAAGMLTPLGLETYGYVFGLAVTSSVASSVSEWLPPDPTKASGMLFLVATVASLGLLAWRRKSVRIYEVLVYAGTFYLAASAVRSAFFWAAALPVIFAPHVAALLPARRDDEESTASGVVNAVIVGCGFLAMLAVQPGVLRDTIGELSPNGQTRQAGEGRFLLNHEHAFVLVDKLKRENRARVFHDQALGGMLEFQLTEAAKPSPVAFVDQRMEFVPETVWNRFFAVSAATSPEKTFAEYEIDTLLLSVDAQWPLVQWALASPDWRLEGADQAHVLFYRASLDGAQDPPKQQ